VVMPGVSIGDGSVVAARSVVTHDVPSNVLVAGYPARRVMSLTGTALQRSVERLQPGSLTLLGEARRDASSVSSSA
jgi:serine acetyltransferase